MLGRRQYVVAVLIGASFAMASLGGISVINAAISYDPGTHFSAPNTKALTIAVTPKTASSGRVAIGEAHAIRSLSKRQPASGGTPAASPRHQARAAPSPVPADHPVRANPGSVSPSPSRAAPSPSLVPSAAPHKSKAAPTPAPAASPVSLPATPLPAATTTSTAPTQTTTGPSPTPPPAPVDTPGPVTNLIGAVGQTLAPSTAPVQQVVGSLELGSGAGQ